MTAPAWRQLEAILLERITSGEYGPAVLIPSENEMVREFSMSRGTVRKTLAALRYEGWVVPVGGRGTYVADPLPEHGAQAVRQSRCLGCPEIHSMACVKPSVSASCRVGSADMSGSLIHALNRSAMFVFMGGNDIGASPWLLRTLRR